MRRLTHSAGSSGTPPAPRPATEPALRALHAARCRKGVRLVDDEPLESRMPRRDASRRPVRALKAVRLDGSEGAAHVRPEEPRLVMRWDGVQWLPETVVADYATAQRLLHGIDGNSVVRPLLAPHLGRGTGRHKKPRYRLPARPGGSGGTTLANRRTRRSVSGLRRDIGVPTRHRELRRRHQRHQSCRAQGRAVGAG
ncbi:DUF6087 family protein [Kitasatospora sp. NPDC059571]|uniref:DUF6087 family protein n=1 Tax=Kitasatospora sp. NPDC059571 TaxID=3346871 RepID=UPI0036CA8BD0